MRYIWAALTLALLIAFFEAIHPALATFFVMVLLVAWLAKGMRRSFSRR